MTKFRSKWFQVAVEGATTDGRVIEKTWLVDAAQTFDRKTYGARVWLEHIRSTVEDSPFKAYGDVLALKTEEVEISGQKKTALFAQIEPTSELIAMNKRRQKLYTSIEIDPNFAKSGKAYLVGLAVTDSPASIGTEMLAFSAQHPNASPLKSRKTNANCLFSAAEETALEFEELSEGISGIFARVNALLSAHKNNTDTAHHDFTEVTQAVEHIAKACADQETARQALEARFNELEQRLKTTPATTTTRPHATGGTGAILADF